MIKNLMELIGQYDNLENDPDILFAMGGDKLPRTKQELKRIVNIIRKYGIKGSY